jgi:hypothetical protein
MDGEKVSQAFHMTILSSHLILDGPIPPPLEIEVVKGARGENTLVGHVVDGEEAAGVVVDSKRTEVGRKVDRLRSKKGRAFGTNIR